MVEKLIKEINEKYNLEITYKQKFFNVYTISFKLEGNETEFTFMYDNLSSYSENLKEFENKVNTEIIYYYKRKEK